MRAALVTDQPLLAAGLNAVFEKSRAFQLVAVYANAAELLDMLPAISPELAIVDVGPGSSLHSFGDLTAAAPNCKVVLLARSATAEMMFQAQEAGVSALLPTGLSVDRLLSCLERVRCGDSVFECVENGTNAPARAAHLTRRENQLVELVSRGLKNKEIATCLGIAEGTVKVYLSKLFQKVGANDRLELALFGLKNMSGHSGSVAADAARATSPALRHLPVRGPKTLLVRVPQPSRVAL
ncbi:MAG: response regulator transcription factor [Bryobacteraceae bacterium]|nr:response regulator transcription factor [Bryobacteraceae bacterium]